jgi:hypothetical protein
MKGTIMDDHVPAPELCPCGCGELMITETDDPIREHIKAVRKVERAAREDMQRYAENELLKNLIRWIAPRIERRNANGMPSDRFCLLCVMGQPQFRRQPCRHDEIFQIAKESAE